MTSQEIQRKPNVWPLLATLTVIVVLAAAAVIFGGSTLRDRWKLVVVALGGGQSAAGGHGGHEDDDDHAGHGGAKDSIELDELAQRNIGIKVKEVALKPFLRTISIPAMIVEVPGHSRRQISAPMTGIVTRIYHDEGDMVGPNEKLFDLRLTHEELVQAQSEFLRVVAQLRVANDEVKRLQSLSQDGGLGRSQLREHIYEKKKLAADLNARRQGLQLHGLTAAEVREIEESGTLLAGLIVRSPADAKGLWQIDQLNVQLGQHAEIGASLAAMTNYRRLLIQGKAFDQDATILRTAQNNQIARKDEDWTLTAVVNANGRRREVLWGLKILRIANGINRESRALDFYVQFDNKLLDTPEASADASAAPRYLSWEHRPGQRVQLQVPVSQKEDQIVLPIDAVVEDGANRYVFVQVGNEFRRRSVRVLERNQDHVMIAQGESLKLKRSVVVSGAYLIHLAIKKKAGEGGGGHGHVH
jgi:multidrug efflux pump subunit AcrA (membrane-fusion protein)